MDISSINQVFPDQLLSNKTLSGQTASKGSCKGLQDSKSTVSSNSVTAKEEAKDAKALKEACQGFEAIFINTMLKSMRSTIPQEDIFGKSQGMDIYTSMHDQYLAEKISREENSTGIGEYLYRQLQESL